MSEPSRATDVVAILVSHDGASWLPAVLDGLRSQTTPVAGLVAIDTQSKDGSDGLIEQAFPGSVTRVDRGTSYPQAVRAALDLLREQDRRPAWVWLLHDDANPAPDALARLLAAAAERPDADILGPKLREWPSLKRLLELGVTISGTGRRETGLERGEYDQGQHDEVREVFAVNSAGMLVRREVLEELGGFDEQLPMFGNDLDLGWRAAAAGHTTLVVPSAVVFHAEAAHRGIRQTPLTGRHTHYQERRAALYTLLVNRQGWTWPLQAVRLFFGSLLRVLGFLVVRSPGEALDELAAVLSVMTRPGPVLAARRARRASYGPDGPDQERVRRLLAPWWLPYRHGLDLVGDLVAAATNQAADVAERRRIAAAERDPSPPPPRHSLDDDEIEEDSGLLVRLLTSPVALLLGVALVVFLIGARDVFGTVVGGALSPAPATAGDWWSLHLGSTHPLGFGSDVPAPAYVLPLALLASLVGTTTTVTLLFVLSVPLATWGAWRFLRVVGRLVSRYGAPSWLLLWGSVSYALVPLVSGAWDGGRFGVVAAAALLPWLAHAALGFAEPEAGRRWRAAWRVGLLLALTAAFAPVVWWFAAGLVLAVLALATLVARAAVLTKDAAGPPLSALGVALLLLAPWWLPALLQGAGAATLLDVGRWPTAALDGTDLVLGRFGELGAWWWLGVAPPVLALLALVPRATRIPVVVCWLVAAVAAAVALVVGMFTLDLPSGIGQQPGLGVLLLVLHASWVTAAVVGAQGALEATLPSPVRAGLAVVVAAAVLAPVAGLVWFVGWGGEGLHDEQASDIPAFMVERAESGDQHGILVVRGSVAEGLTYHVQRGDGATVGEDEIEALTPEDPAATELIRELATVPSPEAVRELGARGIAYLVMPAPADGNVAARLDATGGLRRASAEDRETRAWRLVEEPAADAVAGDPSWLRIGLLVLQGLAIPTVVVLGLPTLRATRRRS